MVVDPQTGSQSTNAREKWLRASSRTERGVISFKILETAIAEMEEIRNGIPEKPWRSASEMYRQLLVWGLERGEELGFPTTDVHRALNGAIAEERYDRWKAYNEGLVDRYKKRVDEARTILQYTEVKNLGDELISACTDGDIKAELVALRARMA